MPEINPKVVKDYHQHLLKNKSLLDFYLKRRGLTLETVKRFEIGYDLKSGRFIIPVKDVFGAYVNLRKWKANCKGPEEPKMISETGFGETRLWPIEIFKKKRKSIIICEGEHDAMLLVQHGIMSITKTGGVRVWRDEWNEYFVDKNVAIIFDCQDVSREAAKKLSGILMKVARNIKIIDLGLGNKEDITDWFLKYKRSAQDLLELMRQTPIEDLYQKINLSNSLESKYYDKRIKFNGVLIGKDLSPFLIPKKVEVVCNRKQKNKNACEFCDLKAYNVKHEFTYEKDKQDLVKMINCGEEQLSGAIKKSLKIPSSTICRSPKINILSRQNVEDIRIIPELNFARIDTEYVIRRCFYFGLDAKMNQGYLFRGTTAVDPSNQMGVHLVKEIVSSQDNISKFQMTDEIKKNLKIFQPEEPDSFGSIDERLKEIHTDMIYNITKMYGRESIVFGTEIVYHSVLSFDFLNERQEKGWLEMACIGDTQCGKSKTIERLLRHFRAGEFITSSENTTRPGLLGGSQQTQAGRNTIIWGKLPLNDKRLVVIDEADNLTKKKIIGLLTGVRSSGIAELVIMPPQKTTARVRLIWIANPLYNKMSEHNYGIEVVKELFIDQQDISRIDFAIAVSDEDVPDEIINKRHVEKYPHKYTSDLCHQRVMFAWSRKPEHIVWAEGTEDLILELAQKFGRKYSADIPIVTSADMRIKLARMSISLACMLYSTDKTGENVVVRQAHVLIIARFLQNEYNKPVMGYLEFSRQRRREKKLQGSADFDLLITDEETVDALLDLHKFQLNDLDVIFDERGRAVKILKKAKAIKKEWNFYKKTPAFITWLKEKKKEYVKSEEKF